MSSDVGRPVNNSLTVDSVTSLCQRVVVTEQSSPGVVTVADNYQWFVLDSCYHMPHYNISAALYKLYYIVISLWSCQYVCGCLFHKPAAFLEHKLRLFCSDFCRVDGVNLTRYMSRSYFIFWRGLFVCFWEQRCSIEHYKSVAAVESFSHLSPWLSVVPLLVLLF